MDSGLKLWGIMTASAIVISDDSPTLVKSAARLAKVVFGDRIQICDGVNDQVEILAAAAVCGGGTVAILGGNLNISDFTLGNCTLRGQGIWNLTTLVGGTVLNVTGTITIIRGGRLHELVVKVPDAYAADAIVVDGSVRINHMARVWDNIHVQCDTATGTAVLLEAEETVPGERANISNCSFGDITIAGFEYGLVLRTNEVAGDAFITGNTFERIFTSSNNGVYLEIVVPGGAIAANHFLSIYGERDEVVSPILLHIEGGANVFDWVYGWEFNTSTLVEIAAGAIGNQIRTWGRANNPNFIVDNGIGTIVTDLRHGGILGNRATPLVNTLSNIMGELFFGAKVFLPFTEGVDPAWADNLGTYNRKANLPNSGTWGTVPATGWGRLTLNGTNQRLSIEEYDVDDSETFIVVCRPDFDWDENTSRGIFYLTVDGNNQINLSKFNAAATYVLRWRWQGGGVTRDVDIFPWDSVYPRFSAGDILIIIASRNNTTGDIKLYVDGKLLGTTAGSVATVGTGTLEIGVFISYFRGDFMLFATLPRCLQDVEAAQVSQRLANLVGKTYNQFSATDLFKDCIVASVTHVAGAIQPDGSTGNAGTAPAENGRGLMIRITNTDGVNPQTPSGGWVTVHGIDAKGNAISEVFVVPAVAIPGGGTTDVIGNAAFASGITVDYYTETNVNITVSVGTSDKLGLKNGICAVVDVYKLNLNSADYSAYLVAAKVDPIYSTIDCDEVNGAGTPIAANDNIEFCYKSNLNLAS